MCLFDFEKVICEVCKMETWTLMGLCQARGFLFQENQLPTDLL